MRRKIRLNEAQLHGIITESVKSVLNEISYDTAKNAFKKSTERLTKNGWKGTERKKAQMNNLYRNFADRSQQNFEPDMPVVIVGGELQGNYIASEIAAMPQANGFVKPSQNPIYADSHLIGYPILNGYIGPMWDGEKIRYESQEAYDFFSR